MPKTSTTTPPRTPTIASETELDAYCNRLANQASAASEQLTKHSGSDRSAALHNVAERLLNATDAILSANAKDVDQAQQNGLTGALLSRLGLDPGRLHLRPCGLGDLPGDLGLLQGLLGTLPAVTHRLEFLLERSVCRAAALQLLAPTLG